MLLFDLCDSLRMPISAMFCALSGPSTSSAMPACRIALPARQGQRGIRRGWLFHPETPQQEASGQAPQRDHLRRLAWVWVTGGLIAVSLAPVVVLVPTAPRTVSATALSEYRILVTWAAVPGATGYNVDNGCPIGSCRPGASLAKTTGSVTTADFAVTPGTYQCFEAQAFNSLGTSGWSNYS